ncbi:MAG: hypothetical protein ABI892_20155, partial [Flavobacterium sp.]
RLNVLLIVVKRKNQVDKMLKMNIVLAKIDGGVNKRAITALRENPPSIADIFCSELLFSISVCKHFSKN